jgi:hypothetical protein
MINDSVANRPTVEAVQAVQPQLLDTSFLSPFLSRTAFIAGFTMQVHAWFSVRIFVENLMFVEEALFCLF